MNRVAITGVGIICCLGTDRDAVARRLYQGQSAVEVDPERVSLGFRSALTTRIEGFDASQHVNRKARKTMTEFAVQAYVAVTQALEDAGQLKMLTS